MGDKQSGLKEPNRRLEMSSCTQMDMVGSETSNQAQKDLIKGGTQDVVLKLTLLDGRQAARLERAW